MEEKELRKLKKIKDIKEITSYISSFYPDLNISEYTIEEIEVALVNTYIKIIGKILRYAPENMRLFLKDYLLKYEITNIKQLILGSIVGIGVEEKEKNINFLVEEYLENSEFIRDLIAISSLDEIQFFMRGTKYNEAVREGIIYFKNNNEVFVLEAFLDQLYYNNLIKKKKIFNKKERMLITLFVDYKTEIYNINMIYRGLKNKIDKKLLIQFLVKNYLFLDKQKIDYFLNLKTPEKFISELDDYLKKKKQIKLFYIPLKFKTKNFMKTIERFYINYYFKQFKIQIDDIESSTIFKILEVLILKEKEIWFDVLPHVVKIINDRFKVLKSYIK